MRRGKIFIWILLTILIFQACIPAPESFSPTATNEILSSTATAELFVELDLPPVTGTEPSNRIAAFYYPWYHTPQVDGFWDHWGEGDFHPPLDIASDYYPQLGAYSVADPLVLAQHFAWLRAAGVGVIISSWWGQGSREDQTVPLILDIAEHYGISVTFHIEPYSGRTANRLASDIRYLYTNYGDHPAFFRTATTSRWSPDPGERGLFFVWAIGSPDTNSPPVEATYWQQAMDTIHNMPDGALIIANTTDGYWIDGGHFDGLYNYVTLNLEDSNGFAWARDLPPESLYIPSVIPGFSARRIAYPEEVYAPRNNGTTYEEQWEAALGTYVEPAMITITSFNEWHEGSQIEPAAVDANDGSGYTYQDYETLPPEGYLTLTQELGNCYLSTIWPEMTELHLRLVTSSDWTDFYLESGAFWLQPDNLTVSDEASQAGIYDGRFLLSQPIERASAGGLLEINADMQFTGWESGGTVVFGIARGHLGYTLVEISRIVDGEFVIVETFQWGGISGNADNSISIQIPADELFLP